MSATIAAALGHDFARPELLREALTHRSAAPRRRRGQVKGTGSNERLEFVGDRVLNLLMAEWLIERFPDEQEGALGKRIAHLVSQPVLAEIALAMGMGEALDVAPGEARAGIKQRATVLADALEAALGAIYLDAGLDPARRLVRREWEAVMAESAAPPRDNKMALQEWVQGRGLALPAYEVVSTDGPSHAPVFVVRVTIGDATGEGAGATKRAAEQAAAGDALRQLGV